MTDSDRTYRIFISAAEPSGDKLCAKLITALKQTGYKMEIAGFGGPNMAQAGCTLLINTTQKAAMTYNAFGHIRFFYKALQRAKKHFAETKPALVIVCDSPSFNFHIAKAAKAAGIKTLFYVAPQLWAWAAWRIEKLKRLCTAGLAAILPFEPDWFASRGLECQFVGNPLLEDINARQIVPKKYKNFSVSGAHIALVPGSRKSEIETLWPAMQHIARRLKARHPSLRFTAVAANEQVEAILRRSEMKILRCNYAIDAVHETAQKVDFALVASGSATLQVAAAACPMVIMYQSNKYLWHLVGKRIVKTKYLSLVNILAQKELVPEFMPYFPSIAPIVDICEKLLNTPEKLADISIALAELAKPLAGINTSRNITEMIIKQLDEPENFTA
ncbi:MAG: lipid-A-disaccharide synthase [Phycisphaerae bacterium]|nr:lipid-A-disaccharide synthase [Phycisphaerae bacterium]